MPCFMFAGIFFLGGGGEGWGRVGDDREGKQRQGWRCGVAKLVRHSILNPLTGMILGKFGHVGIIKVFHTQLPADVRRGMMGHCLFITNLHSQSLFKQVKSVQGIGILYLELISQHEMTLQ